MDKTYIFQDKTEVTHGRGYVYSLMYHIVWCTKYRKQIMTGDIRKDVIKHLHTCADDLNINIIALEVMPDHIHILADCKPQCRPSDAIKIFKGNTARWLFITHPELKKQLYGGHLWNPSYFISTVSDRNREQIEDYINNQQKE